MKTFPNPKLKKEFSDKIGEDHSKWLPRGNLPLEMYGNCAMKYNRNKTIAHYMGLVNRIPLDIIK